MCRSIKVLRGAPQPVTPEEISAAALQFVRKVSGSRKPSRVNQVAFDAAVAEIARATTALLRDMTPVAPKASPGPAPGSASVGRDELREVRGGRELDQHRLQ